jgi:hypothetical protein
MRKKIKKIVTLTLFFFITLVSGVITLVLYPQFLFANKLAYKNFKIYSNDKIANDIKIVLDNAMDLVKKSELNDSNYRYNIILCYNSLFNAIDDKLFGNGPSSRATGNNVLIKVRIDPKKNLAFPTFRKECVVDLSYLLAHEMIHCLQAHKYGIIKFNPFKHPVLWKLEGYPEYIALATRLSSKDYNLPSEIDRYVNLDSQTSDNWILAEEGGCEVPKYYLKGRLMIEYLIGIKHLSYDEILNNKASENSVYYDMIKWKGRIEGIKN